MLDARSAVQVSSARGAIEATKPSGPNDVNDRRVGTTPFWESLYQDPDAESFGPPSPEIVDIATAGGFWISGVGTAGMPCVLPNTDSASTPSTFRSPASENYARGR